jgi:hypothetical protein
MIGLTKVDMLCKKNYSLVPPPPTQSNKKRKSSLFSHFCALLLQLKTLSSSAEGGKKRTRAHSASQEGAGTFSKLLYERDQLLLQLIPREMCDCLKKLPLFFSSSAPFSRATQTNYVLSSGTQYYISPARSDFPLSPANYTWK